MSTTFLASLGLAVAIVAGARLALPGLPLPGRAVRLHWADMALIAGGALTLAFHCAAMFFKSLAELLPGSAGAISDIRALGTASVIWYVLPALAVLIGLRRVPWAGLAVVCLALSAIGITMYNGNPVDQHLLAIWVGVVLSAGVLATFVGLPTSAPPSQYS